MLIFLSIIIVLLFGFLGASLSSFASVVKERTKRHESINGRSHCVCGRQLKWYENVPIIGWLRIGGITKCCNAKLPASYLIGEIVGFLIFSGIGILYMVYLGVFR